MYIRPYIILNGVSSLNLMGLLITELPPITKPLKRTKVDVIDGRDGDIVTELGYSAYDKVVKIGLTANYDIDAIIKYFNSEGVVIFSNEPDKYYRYAIYEQIDFERLLRFKTAEVTLHVQPFKFSNTEKEKEFTYSGGTLAAAVYNAGNYFSRPTIKVTGTGDINVSLNGSQILAIALGDTSQTIKIDAETMNAYYSDDTLANRAVTGNYDNIKLPIGANNFTFTGNLTAFKVNKYSRWI